jgi:hypothetical protein
MYRKMPMMSKEHVPRIIRWRSVAAFAITFVNVAVALLFLGTLTYLLAGPLGAIPDIDWSLMLDPQPSLSEKDGWDQIFLFGSLVFFGLTYVGVYVLPIVVTLPLSAPIIALWESPPTFLFLRPFHRGVLSKPLKRIARRDIAPFGHTYTLSDADIYVPWYVRVPLVLGQLALLSFRLKVVRSSKRLGAIDRAIGRTWLRNVNWCMSWNKVFPVASTDEYWQAVVNVFLARADIVFIDVSDLREHVVWEIKRAHTLGMATRMLFLVHADQESRITSELALLLPGSFDAVRVFAHDSHGLVERDRFRSLLVGALTSTDGRGRGGPASALSVAATAFFVITAVPLTVLLYRFWNGLVSQDPPDIAGLLSRDPTGITTVGLGLLTLVLLLVASRANRPMRFLLTVQALLLFVAATAVVVMIPG